ncbi:MAG: hypothetical protein IT161_23815 [Bryobacterales bacterium]|nr:hypothetical protein [Bryobacterales bacterium]
MLTIILIGISTLVSEDLTCIAAGVLISRNQLGLAEGLAGCTVGIFAGDLLLVAAGRYATLLRIKTPAIPGSLIQRATHVLLWTRFTPGLRLPAYLGAGLLRLPMRTVIPPLAAGAVVWTPLLVGLAALSGAAFVTSALKGLELAVAVFVLWRILRSYERRRRILGFFHRLVRWEFWPPWAVYAPAIPYLLWLGLKHRSLTAFTAANPGIPTGGLVGESKSSILAQLRREPEFAAPFESVEASSDGPERIQAFMRRHGLSFPIVLKPDVGERGSGVAIARNIEQARAYFERARGLVIAQQYVAGEEFGVFYFRRPGEATGKIISITHKRLPCVTGDGRRTLARLVLDDARAFILYGTYRRLSKRPLSDVPGPGECVPLAEIGSHCRGAIFLDAARLNTPALERAVDRVSKAHAGFYFGRFDVRAAAVEALQKGQFKVLELNGVGAEATHVYDPAVSIMAAYRAIFHQWRSAYEIGAANRASGAGSAGLGEILTAWRAATRRRPHCEI